MLHLAALLIGFVLDLLLGEPKRIPHPIIGIGRLISLLERYLCRPTGQSPKQAFAYGALLWLIVVMVSTLLPLLLIQLAGLLHPLLVLSVESLLDWLILSTRSLVTEAKRVEQSLFTGDLPAARNAVSRIVGRDTDRLSAEGVTRAAVETVAENTTDGIVAPLLFVVLGGAPLGMAYKAVSTMDSMIGYIDPPYTYFGRFAARADDLFALIPARLAALLMLLAGGLLGMDLRNGWRIFCRDRYRHASPNSAQTEAVIAGLLGIRLAGDATYGGQLHRKPFIGDPLRPIEPADIGLSCRVALLTACLALFFFVSIALFPILL